MAVVGYLSTGSSGPSKQASGQSVLPFNGIDFRLSPGGVTLDSAGNVYVTSEGMYGRVVKLTTGSDATTVLPFNGLYQPQGLAVDGAGTVYVADFNNRVISMAAGSNSQKELPFTGLSYPEGVAVDSQGSGVCRRPRQQQGGETGGGVQCPDRAAVQRAQKPGRGGRRSRGQRLRRGHRQQQGGEARCGVEYPVGVAISPTYPCRGASPWTTAGTVYVTEHDKSDVVKYAQGATTGTVMPFNGLNTPLAVTVDKDQNVYVADRGNNRVVKLTP